MPTNSPPEFASLVGEPIALPPQVGHLTVDVEDWFHVNFASASPVDEASVPRRVESGVAATLELLAESGAQATFFVLGSVAKQYPQMLREVVAAGHEVASHSLHHDLVYEMDRPRFAQVASDARRALEDIISQPVLGFRAPSWSICERNLWALEVIAEAGFVYDSSIFPGASPLYGVATAPTGAYGLRLPGGLELLEVPPSVMDLGVTRVGIGGGLYLRALPVFVQRFVRWRYQKRGEPFMLYVHPRELDPSAWDLRLELSWFDQQLHRFGIRSTPRKLRSLLSTGAWSSIAGTLRRIGALPVA